MKKLLIIFVLTLLISTGAFAADLRWDASAGEVKGYTVYWTDSTGEPFNKTVSSTTLAILDIDNALELAPKETYNFIVKAYNDSGESGPSNSVDFTANHYSPPTDKTPGGRKSKPNATTLTKGE